MSSKKLSKSKKERIEEEVYDVVNSKTGQLKTKMYEGDIIYRRKSQEYMESTGVINNSEMFVKIFDKALEYLYIVLTEQEISCLGYLLTKLEYSTCLIKDEVKKTPLTYKDMAKDMGLKEATTRKIVNNLCDLGILAVMKVGRNTNYVMNPYLSHIGKRVSKIVVDGFNDTVWAMLYDKYQKECLRQDK